MTNILQKTNRSYFAFHGYETLIRTIFFDRHNHHLMIHGYKENGDITTPFDMRVVNELDRYHLAKDAALKIKGSQAEDFAKKNGSEITRTSKLYS